MDPISLYIPARNAEASLRDSIDAVLRQTRPPDEFFIVLDPRSTDATAEIARASGVRVIEQTGSTLGAARNQAVSAARHRWIACCDSDVIIRPDWLERLAERRGGEAVAIGGRTVERVCNPFDAWRAMHMPHHWGEHPVRNPFMLVSEALFDRDALLAVGGYRDDLNYYEDSDLCQRLREAGYELLYEPAAGAEHQRTDTLASLLALRWNYSEYRQRHLLDRYSGLVEKLAVNREYAMNTLARSLARGREELGYISFLLFFHHLLMDLSALLARRPLIPKEQRVGYCRELLQAAFTSMRKHDGALAGRLRVDLEPQCGGKAGESHPFSPTPQWPAHLGRMTRGIDGFCRSLPEAIRGTLAASAQYCHGTLPAEEVPRLGHPGPEELQRCLDALPITAYIEPSFRGEIVRHWPDATGVHILGPARASEHKALRTRKTEVVDPAMIAVIPHLESRAVPLGVFCEVPPATRRLVVCYQAPARFIPGIDVVTPADLASAASAAGWTISRFDTLVGRIRLMLTRETPTSRMN